MRAGLITAHDRFLLSKAKAASIGDMANTANKRILRSHYLEKLDD
jgi:hypothetical protein